MKRINVPAWIVFANGKECMTPHWATPRNCEQWQGRGKRRKPKRK